MDIRLKAKKLLNLIYNETIEGLKELGVIRTNGLPPGEYAEWLVCRELGLEQHHDPSNKSYDAIDKDGIRYQIKCRHFNGAAGNRIIGMTKGNDYDFLIVIYLSKEFDVVEAWKIPYSIAAEYMPNRNSTVTKKIQHIEGVEPIPALIGL